MGKRGIRHVIKSICNECGAKCCKSSLKLPAHHITLYPGDFTSLVSQGYLACLSMSVAAGHIQRVIRPHIFGYCPFLNLRTNKCKIYAKRPLSCRVFPYERYDNLGIKDECILYAKTKKEKRQSLGIKNFAKFTSTKYVHKYQRDEFIFNTVFQPRIDEILGIDPRLITNDFGSFAFFSSNERTEGLILPKLFSLLDSYSSFFSTNQIYIVILVANENYFPVCLIKGIVGYFNNIGLADLLEEVTNVQGIYYEELMDCTLLDGLVFDYEINYPDSYWIDTWTTIKSISHEFKSR